MIYSGARILVESLIEEGVDTVFGIPGGYVLHIYDELYKCQDRIRHILVSHEQHAAHAADGYARSSGRTGVCIATSGPGATNLVTGIAAAYMDSVPLVAVTGNVPLHLLGKDSFQETDIAGITMPVVKHNWIVKDVRELAEVIREAFIVARTGRPGPVLIDIPADVSAAETEWKPALVMAWEDGDALGSRARRLAERSERVTFSDTDIERAADMIKTAKRPMIYAGGGINLSGASGEVVKLSTLLNAPVALSLMGTGAVPRNFPLCTGLIGMHGTTASNRAVQQADLLIAAGARFSDRVTSKPDRFARNAKILHIDMDPAEINKNRISDFSVVGDVKEILQRIIKKLPRTFSHWNGEIEKLKEKDRKPETKIKKKKGVLHPRFIMETAAERMSSGTIVVTDVGQHQIWTAQYYPIAQPRSFISSGGLGAMGFGLGAAAGAKLANPDRPVLLFTGDGSFLMNSGELATLCRYSIPILIILLNNSSLGMVRQWQHVFYGDRFSETVLTGSPDFSALAAAYKILSFAAASEEEYRTALDRALKEIAEGRAAFIEVPVDKQEMVLPMVPGGKPVDEQIV
ncbi:MAG: biosynthetic-type acetolactate synthase large subunit [Treponema sp.]|jgi:acetolactate synthase-1/2/3 large subunit|nr:biosynthetic-type acetolactate synthase large subunit [Treponema sp.]